MNNSLPFPSSLCMDTAPVSQRAHSYNPEIHPKESLLGKQTKNNRRGNSAGSEATSSEVGANKAAFRLLLG